MPPDHLLGPESMVSACANHHTSHHTGTAGTRPSQSPLLGPLGPGRLAFPSRAPAHPREILVLPRLESPAQPLLTHFQGQRNHHLSWGDGGLLQLPTTLVENSFLELQSQLLPLTDPILNQSLAHMTVLGVTATPPSGLCFGLNIPSLPHSLPPSPTLFSPNPRAPRVQPDQHLCKPM